MLARLVLAALLTLAATPALAQTPSVTPTPDPAFNGGAPYIAPGATNAWAYAVAVLPDGAIRALGLVGGNPVIVGLRPDGTPDPGFGSDGIAPLPAPGPGLHLGMPGSTGHLEVLPDGRLIAALNRRIARLFPDGTPDPTFGAGGATEIPATRFFRSARFTITPDGAIYWAGYAREGSVARFGLVRLSADGEPDTEWGIDGVRLFGPTQRIAHDVRYEAGMLWVVGTRQVGSVERDAVAARLSLDGELDPTWGDGGIAVIETGGPALAMGFQSTGRLVAVGPDRTGNVTQTFAVRFTLTGQPDATFGTDGYVRSAISNDATTLNALTVLPDDRLLAVGGSAFVSFAADGSESRIDALPLSTPGWRHNPEALAVLPDGRVVVAGATRGVSPPTVDRFVVRRLTTALTFIAGDETLDPTFNGTGVLLTDLGGTSIPLDSAVLPDGSTVALHAYNEGALVRQVLIRIRPDGSRDPAFGTDGLPSMLVSYAGTRLIAIPEGFLVAGSEPAEGGRRQTLARLGPDGLPDLTFGEAGVVRFPALPLTNVGRFGLHRLPDGRLLFATVVTIEGARFIAVLRLLATGAVDATYGVQGVALVPVPMTASPTDLLVYADGTAHVLFATGIARLTPAGVLDAAFGNGGIVVPVVPEGYQPQRLVRGGGGRLVLVGSDRLLRFLADGSVDVSFGSAGVATPAFGLPAGRQARLLRATVLADGRIVVSGLLFASGMPQQAFVGRATAEGAVDPTFGDAGSVRFGIGWNGLLDGLHVTPEGRAVAVGQTRFNGRRFALLTAFEAGAAPVAAEPGAAPEALATHVYPNPVRSGATLRLTLSAPSHVAVTLYDVLGRRVRVLHDGPLAAGTPSIPFDVAGLAPGTYVVHVRTDGVPANRATRRFTVLP